MKSAVKKKTLVTKKSTGKRKMAEMSDPEVDPEVTDLVPPSQKRKVLGKKIPSNVPPAPLDNVSFHFESGASRWRYVHYRRLARERELHANALKSNEIMSLISAAGLQKTVTQTGRCYEDLVKEFLVNVAPEVGKAGHIDYYRVYVRGRPMEFSPMIINRYLNRSEAAVIEDQVPLGTISKILTANKGKEGPASATFQCSKISPKYAFLNKIGAENGPPRSHTSSVHLHM